FWLQCGEYPEHPLVFGMGNSSGKSRVSDHVAFETCPTPPIPNIVVHAATPLSTPVDPAGAPTFARYGSPTDGPDDPSPPPLPRTPPPPLPSSTSSQLRSSGRRPSVAQLGAAAAAAVRHQRRDQSPSSSRRRPSQPLLFKAPPIPVIVTEDHSSPRRPDTLDSYGSYEPLPSPPAPRAPPPTPFEKKEEKKGMSALEAFLARRRMVPPDVSSPVLQSRETTVFGTPHDLPPPLPVVPPPASSDDDSAPSPLISPPVNAPTPKPRERKNIVYAKDRVAQFEALNTTIRDEMSDETMKIRDKKSSVPSKTTPDNYPIYNPIEDFSFSSGMQFQKGSFPIDTNRSNIGVVGRSGVGKSTLINALRGINRGDPQAAGRSECEMEPFRFIEPSLQHLIIWEISYPKSFSSVSDMYDRNMSFNRFYDAHKLNNFAHVFVLIGDGAPTDDDIAFARVVKSRRTPLTLVLSKTDIDIDAEARELNRPVNSALLTSFVQNANRVFTSVLERKAPVLLSTPLLTISAPVTRNLVSGTRGFLAYKSDEERLLDTIGLQEGCHAELEAEQQRQLMTMGYASREQLTQGGADYASLRNLPRVPSHPLSVRPTAIHKSTVLADAGFEISYDTDDRVFGNMEPKTGVRRTGRTNFNYAFVGGKGVGKSSMINAMRGMTSKHPLAAGKGRAKAASIDKFEFDDEILKYSVSLWEMHYPRRVNNFFEFIDANNIASFTAIFVIVRDGIPSDEDLTFAKIAHRRSASVVLLSSRTDLRLKSRSRSDEIPVCDLLKQRFIEKGVDRFDRRMQSAAPELSGRVHLFFVSAPVFLVLRSGRQSDLFLVHERAVFDFLKQKRIIADMLDLPVNELKEGLYANVNLETAGVYPEDPIETRD
ncbi:hypothetical protein PENTCL1PPCAC_25597, partial [Pristionchus entomophagus]